jgi:hypothetical protein
VTFDPVAIKRFPIIVQCAKSDSMSKRGQNFRLDCYPLWPVGQLIEIRGSGNQ